MIHKIINPNSTYTIESDRPKILTAAIFLIGEGEYSTLSSETDFQVPTLKESKLSTNEVFKELFREDFISIVTNNKDEIGKCLKSVCLGDEEDRAFYLTSLNKMDNKRESQEFIYDWNSREGTIMTSLVSRAKNISASLLA